MAVDPELQAILDKILGHAQEAASVRALAEANAKAIGVLERKVERNGEAIHVLDKCVATDAATSAWVVRIAWLVVGGGVTGGFGLAAWALYSIASG